MTPNERRRAEALARDLARVCMDHGAVLKARAWLCEDELGLGGQHYSIVEVEVHHRDGSVCLTVAKEAGGLERITFEVDTPAALG